MSTDTNVDKPFAPNPQHEDKDLDEWLNAEMEKRMCGECKSVYTNKNIRVEAPSCGTNKVQEVSFVAEEEEGDTSGTLPCQLPPKELNPGSFTCNDPNPLRRVGRNVIIMVSYQSIIKA
ncbi:hypothetical protein Tco_1532350 [Tanacetum coccineum]